MDHVPQIKSPAEIRSPLGAFEGLNAKYNEDQQWEIREPDAMIPKTSFDQL